MENEKNKSEVYSQPLLKRIEGGLQNFLAVWQSQSRFSQVLFVVGFMALFLTTSFLLLYFSQTPNLKEEATEQKISAKILKNRSGPLYGVSGVISSIDEGSGGNEVITLKSDLGVDYQVTVNSNTQVFTVSRELTEKEVKTTRVKISSKELKTGERIYLQSNKDLIEKREISAGEIKSIEVYIDNG